MSTSRHKILMFIDEAKMGGGQQHLLWLINKLDKYKFEIEVACEPEGYFVDELKKLGIKHHSLSVTNRPSIDSLIKTYRIIQKVSPAILHTHGGTAGFYGRLAAAINFKGVTIHTYHGIHYLNAYRFRLKFLYKMVDRFLLNFTDCTICVAQNDFDIGMKAGVVKKEKAVVIHNGIDIIKFSHVSEHNDFEIKLKKEEDLVVIGSVGRLHYQKGYEYLIEASKVILSNHPNVKFVLIGDGELRGSLESLTKKYGIDTSFVFLGNRTEIPELLAQMDIFVLPSLWEGLPLVLLEAMAANKPVVATNVNGITELIKSEEDGILVPPKDASALALGINRLLDGVELRNRLAENGYKKVLNEFSLNGMIEKTESVYLKLLHKKL